MSGRDAYKFLGYFLLPAGAVLAPLSHFVLGSPPLAATGVSMVMMGIICLALARALPQTSSEASYAFLQTAMENISALIEELGLTAKAIYLPASLREGKPQAVIPLLPDAAPQIKAKLPGRLIVRYGPQPQDMGIAVSTLGSASMESLTQKPGPGGKQIEDALSLILVGRLDLATSVRAIENNGQVEVEVSGPRLHYENVWFYRCLGSPLASIVATVTAEAMGKPVVVKSERMARGKSHIQIGVLP